MRVLILAAGYATRLYPLTLHQPKPLLSVGGRPILEQILDRVCTLEEPIECIIVTNHRFAEQFAAWEKRYRDSRPKLDLKILDDGSTSEADRLGAIGDLAFVVERERISDELLVIAGDNLFDASLGDFVAYARKLGKTVVGIYDVGDLEAIRRYNNIRLDGEGRVVFFEEKPQKPEGTLTAIALYYFPAEALARLRQYLAEGESRDQPGRFIEWLCRRQPVFTWRLPGKWFDIGDFQMLETANRAFTKG
ncbi:glucose-1-phosphate thymidylyltransferase [Methylacidimicrobium cyclopophantes]|uniref:Glucose-1-phosphate thymidylyltransferase n=1 Tax=Methylacidimicrobium cyclopophantes TaxID=1041766 RepID=A0A5E6MBJ9_9BACT|nr:nucleotidyltransferase family protein [Methylacidimicrobium cyclopophantes]VVM06340.1 glucose-1-phosphate thymidylyltransferase [Methylacidimicrobium cyclopophantes]